MADHDGRQFALNEARIDRYRVYPIQGEPAPGAIPVVNAANDLEFQSGPESTSGFWAPLSNGDAENPSVLFNDGEVIMTWISG